MPYFGNDRANLLPGVPLYPRRAYHPTRRHHHRVRIASTPSIPSYACALRCPVLAIGIVSYWSEH
eukprot:300045-Rhodomonas_salina.2